MAGEWLQATFQQMIDDEILEIGDGYRAKNEELGGSGPIFLRAGHVTDSHIDFTGVEYFREEVSERLLAKMSRVGDTIITTKGNSTGRTSFVTELLLPFVYSPHLSYWRSRDPQKLCGGFLRYWSRGIEFINQLSAMKTSTDMAPYMSLTDQRRLSITLPPLAQQKAIASILGSLDAKIELNRRMNATLEGMARALFQSWFVDFDPVRAKLDGRHPPGLDQQTADLFPDAFEESELGPIPKGWNVGSILEEAKLLSGGTPKTSIADYWDGVIPWASAKDVSQCGETFLIGTERSITELGLQMSSTKIIPEYATVVVSRGATTGRLTMFGRPIAMNQTCYGLRSKFGSHFTLYCHARNFIERTVHAGHGSIFATITTSTFEVTKVLLAPKKIQLAFNAVVAPLFQQILSNQHQTTRLGTLRDTLLPKLLSGELPVPAVTEEALAST